jgi:hypothetical protein
MGSSSGRRHFFAEAVTPIERTHRAAINANGPLKEIASTQRLEHMSVRLTKRFAREFGVSYET